MKISLDNVDVFIFDFDGVLTNNLVQIDENGNESVSCSRADGLAFDVLRKLKKPVYIISTEKNPVVTARAEKLKIPVLQGINSKMKSIQDLADRKRFNLKNILYVGNDVNDYHAMQLCGYTACPSDSHQSIRNIADLTLSSKGGDGVVRELLEEYFNIDFLNLLY